MSEILMLGQLTAVHSDRLMGGSKTWPSLSSRKRSDTKQEDLKSSLASEQTHIWHRESKQ